MEIIPLIIQLVLGAGGAVVAGKLLSRVDEGLLINAGIGVFGGIVAGQLLGTIVGWFVPAPSIDLSFMISSIVGGLAGGALLLLIVGSIGRGPMGRVQ